MDCYQIQLKSLWNRARHILDTHTVDSSFSAPYRINYTTQCFLLQLFTATSTKSYLMLVHVKTFDISKWKSETWIKMRQLKGKEKKENAKEKRERKKEFLENKDKIFTVVLPTLGVLFALLAMFVYMSTRPKSVIEGWRQWRNFCLLFFTPTWKPAVICNYNVAQILFNDFQVIIWNTVVTSSCIQLWRMWSNVYFYINLNFHICEKCMCIPIWFCDICD